MFSQPSRYKTIAILAISQILSWGMLYYTFTILAPEIQRETGWRSEIVYGAFSWSLLVAGLFSTAVGIRLDRQGGRMIMRTGSLVCALGLVMLSQSEQIASYFFAWSVLGLAMSLTLYEAAFTTITHEFQEHTRRAISVLTLFAGFASTIFWPTTLYLTHHWSWREILLGYAALQLFVCFPLHHLLSPKAATGPKPLAAQPNHVRSHSLKEALQHKAFWKLALAFAANSFIFSALSVHLITILQRDGHPAAIAVLLSAWIGPIQVAGRIGEMSFARHLMPQTVGKFAFSALPAGLLALLLFGQQEWVVAVFCVLYGLSNGIMTIVRGTIPHALFGPDNYGAISGAISGPALVAKAAGPLLLALLLPISHTALPMLGVLFGTALLSLTLYLGALKSTH
ncbi:MFS transporter [Undibacterium fentianense]|uniref:MFS transporter n=1 Tax=Undibacterium fentianense TaxID=2828728 RepID=A0A941E609_9BURK|nr:MFS transporter [Undibacterium fentianense]MBR7800383.1 MFS transporter [Undibacterium fentianense]